MVIVVVSDDSFAWRSSSLKIKTEHDDPIAATTVKAMRVIRFMGPPWKDGEVNKIRQHPHAPLIYSDKGHAAKGAQPIPLPKWQHSPGVTRLNDLPTECDATSLGQRQ